MKVGDYVRIRWGNGLQTISKCKNIVDMGDTQYAKDDFYIHTDHSGEVIYKAMIIKSSPNIIDLIEYDDILKIIYEDKEYICKVVNVGGIRGVQLTSTLSVGLGIVEAGIESILTKEQFSQMEYKIQ